MIYFDDRQDIIKDIEEVQTQIQKVLEYSLCEEGVNMPCELSVVFTDNCGIRKINKEFRNIDSATDVLSFPMLDFDKNKVFENMYKDYKFKQEDLDDGNLVLGDIVISIERAMEQSIEFGHSFLRECCYLSVHSILHLLGYDHMEEEEKLQMRKKEEQILKEFKILR